MSRRVRMFEPAQDGWAALRVGLLMLGVALTESVGIVLLVPLFALLIPLLKVAPAIYNWRIRSKIFRCYGALRFLEDELKHHFEPQRLNEYRDRLDALDEEASQLRVPLTFTDLVYTLREHVNLVRGILARHEGRAAGGT